MNRFLASLAAGALLCAAVSTTRAQVPTLLNGNLDTPDPVFPTIPQGWRLYNYTQYRMIGDGMLPTTVTHSGMYAILLPGGEGRANGEFEAVHAEEQIDQNNPLSPRNWPQYTFDAPNGTPITISCWFNIPASDPMVGSRFGMKLLLKRSGSDLSDFTFMEWLDIDPGAATAPPGTTIVTLPGGVNGIHTNGQWVRFSRMYNQSQFCGCTPSPTCSCVILPGPPTCSTFCSPPTNPARASFMAERYGATTSTGTVWVDDLSFTQCAADFNGDGRVSVQDIFDFLAAWFANSPSADFNHSGAVSVQDIFDFLAAWFAGCP